MLGQVRSRFIRSGTTTENRLEVGGEAKPIQPRRSAGTADAMTGDVTTRFALEVDMIDPIAESARSLLGRLKAPEDHHVFFEVPAVGSVPDVVIAQFNHQAVHTRLAAGQGPVRDMTAVRTLRCLTAGVRDLDVVSDHVGVSRAHLRRSVLGQLAEDGWVEPLASREGRVELLHPFLPLLSWMVTVEAKRSKWREAVSQARQHLGFANRAFIALDEAHMGPAREVSSGLADVGIGLMSVDAATMQARVVSQPRGRRRPDATSQHLVGERLWDLHLQGRTSGPVYPVFGRELARSVTA